MKTDTKPGLYERMIASMIKIKQMVLAGMFAALTAVCAVVTVPLPITMVPVTLSVLAVGLTGGLLNKGAAVLAQLVYLLLGLVGLPVFSGFGSGPGVLFGPTGGYLIAYPVMAFVIAFAREKAAKRARRVAVPAAMLAAMAILYLLGTVWFAAVTGRSIMESFALAVVPFIVPDLCKMAVAYAVSVMLEKPLGRLSASV